MYLGQFFDTIEVSTRHCLRTGIWRPVHPVCRALLCSHFVVQCFVPGAAEKDVNQVPFVFAAAFMIVAQIRSIRNRVGSLREALFSVDESTG